MNSLPSHIEFSSFLLVDVESNLSFSVRLIRSLMRVLSQVL